MPRFRIWHRVLLREVVEHDEASARPLGPLLADDQQVPVVALLVGEQQFVASGGQVPPSSHHVLVSGALEDLRQQRPVVAQDKRSGVGEPLVAPVMRLRLLLRGTASQDQRARLRAQLPRPPLRQERGRQVPERLARSQRRELALQKRTVSNPGDLLAGQRGRQCVDIVDAPSCCFPG